MPYRIRNTTTGLFSKGGLYMPSWSKRGKVWPNMGALRLHLQAHLSIHKLAGYRDSEVIEFKVVEEEVSRQPVDDVLAAITNKKAEEVVRRTNAERRRVEHGERAELERLRAKYGG